MRARTTGIVTQGRNRRRAGVLALLGGVVIVLAEGALPAQQRTDSSESRRATRSTSSVTGNDSPLRAMQVLEYRPIGAAARVRFEWDQVRGAREYVLAGRWTGTVAWTVRTREYAVTPRSATSWTPRRVTLEVALPEGNHSWKLIAVFGPNETRAVGDSTLLSFAVR